MQVYGHIAENSSNYRKPRRYPTLYGAVQRVCIHVYMELGETLWDAAGYLKFYVHHACLKCENGTDVIVKGTWHAD